VIVWIGHGTVALVVRDHASPSVVLRVEKEIIIELVHASSQLIEIGGVVGGTLSVEVNFHVIERLLELSSGSTI
jgi:hypothetical protein